MQHHGRSPRKRTGGRRRPIRNKRKRDLGTEPTETRVGEPRLKVVDARGGTTKVRALSTETASLAVDDGTKAVEIEDVVANPADPNYARRNVITKGATIATPEGDARVTSRPGQTGQVNAVLLD